MAGLGFYTGNDAESVRDHHDGFAVRRVLKAMAANLTEFNLKFYARESLKVPEAGWTIRHQTWGINRGGDGQFWYLWLTLNGKRVDFQADADDIDNEDGKSYNSAKKLTPDSSGMVKLERERGYVRWNIKVLK